MGLNINESITLKSGMKVNGAYLSFSGQSIGILPGPSAGLTAPKQGQPIPDVDSLKKTVQYTATGTYSIWMNKDAKDSGCIPLETGSIDCKLTKDQLQTSLHTLLYDYVKSQIYKNSSYA